MSDQMMENFAVAINSDGSVVPASPLDNILSYSSYENIKYDFHSLLTGQKLTKSNITDFYKNIVENVNNKQYPTTDHLPLSVDVNGVKMCYVSLDNSVRANINGFPLKNRLSSLCQMVRNMIFNCGSECIIFFSESCRPSFDGGNLNDRKNEMSWFKIREFISDNSDLYYLGECSNNEASNNMAFGVSAFCTQGIKSSIENVLPRRILTEGVGSGALGIQLTSGKIVWGINFPIDLKSIGDENLGAKAMMGLCKLMESHKRSYCAIGDFNTIPGQIRQSITQAIVPNMKFVVEYQITFFGSFYDTVKTEDRWTQLI